MIFLLLIASVGGTLSDKHVETYDLVELNHCTRGGGSYDQWIVYEWAPEFGRFHVVGWELADKAPQSQISKTGTMYRLRLRTGDIRARLYRETWSTLDPEIENKKLWPEELRRGLPAKPRRRHGD